MAKTSPQIGEAERHETPEIVEAKAQELAEQIKKCKHFIAFTGAGISTSAGVPDFRGPEGVWTLRAKKKEITHKQTCTLTAIPTPSHMALVELQNRGILKYLVSQNCDGLHRRSGILPDKISELHGNSNRESCKDCGKEYIRDFRAVASYEKTVRDHRTGRKCALCGGVLHDTIVNFGEHLPALPLKRARAHAAKADLCLVLGSSLTVPPANGIPQTVGRKKRAAAATLAICNLQSTPLDELAGVRVYATADDLMVRVMEKLEIAIPPFVLRRRLAVQVDAVGEERHQLVVSGVDVDGTPVSFLQSVKLAESRRVARAEPFAITFAGRLEPGSELRIQLEFMGHYNEPNLEVVHVYGGEGAGQSTYLLEYNPLVGDWVVNR